MKQKEIEKSMEERAEKLNVILEQQNKEFRIRYCRNWKNNIAYHGYMLYSKNNNISPVIYTSFRDWYENNDFGVVKFLSEQYKELAVKEPVSLEYVKDKEFVLNRIRPRLIGREKNMDELIKSKKAFVQLDNLDMLITFYIHLGETEEESEVNIPVTQDLLLSAGAITLEEAKEYALSNMEKIASIRPIREVLKELVGMECCSEQESDLEKMLICNNKMGYYGAASVLCPSIQNELMRQLGNDVLLLPSSIHEMIAISGNHIDEIDVLREMVEEVNENQVRIDEQLTNSVYMLRNGSLEIVS